MVRAYHLILTCYGFWLPNDPRGSWSDFVRSFELYRVGGRATKVQTKASLAHRPHDHAKRKEAKQALSRPPVVFNGKQARAVALGFADYTEKNGRVVFACAVMPDHVHLVIQRCDRTIETVADQLKARATMFLNQTGSHPCEAKENGKKPTPWARGCWSVFLKTDASIQRAIDYVEQNPIKAGYKPQRYTWVQDFKG
ncbi:MAG: transposase [Phycisphaeraceae bacterium]|nr:transposase [Phycisphaeraceae bacterium]